MPTAYVIDPVPSVEIVFAIAIAHIVFALAVARVSVVDVVECIDVAQSAKEQLLAMACMRDYLPSRTCEVGERRLDGWLRTKQRTD